MPVLYVEQMTRAEIKKAQAEREKRSEVKADTAYIEWLARLAADIEQTQKAHEKRSY